MKKKYTLIFLLLVGIGCKQKNETLIAGHWQGKYWDVYRIGKLVFTKPRYCYYFDVSGECTYHQYYLDNIGLIKRKIFDPHSDVIYPNQWSTKGSIINIRGFSYKFLSLSSKEMVILNTLNIKDTVILKLSKK